MKTFRTFALGLIGGVAALGLCATSVSVAMFSDTESSAGNIATAGSLDLVAADNGWAPSGVEDDLLPGGAVATEAAVFSNNGTLPLQYEVSAHQTGGDATLCGELEAVVSAGGVPQYAGTLMELATSPITLAVAGGDNWQFVVSLPASASAAEFQEKTCEFAFAVDGWQIGLSRTEGFTDHEEIPASVTTGIWVPMPLSPRDGAVINGTYIEQVWTPIVGATKYTYQSCHNDPDADGSCNQRWLVEYPAGSSEFISAKKSASGVGDAVYWWRVKATIGAVDGPWSDAWQIEINNSHQNSVVINEFIPNPIGNDDAPMPNGEWVELYNNKGQDVDVAGWVLYDSVNTHALPITNLNAGGSTRIRSGDFLVVYRNGDGDFSINNDSDTIRLFTAHISTGVLVDSYSYVYPGPGEKPENWSYVRYPDGSMTLIDPIPTPGRPNIAENAEITPEICTEEEYPVEEEAEVVAEEESVIVVDAVEIEMTHTASESLVIIASESADVLSATASGSAPMEPIEPQPQLESAPDVVPDAVDAIVEGEEPTVEEQAEETVIEPAPVVETVPDIEVQPSE